MAQNWEFYRFSTVGLTLLEAVDELVRDGSLSGEIANIIMARFDDAIAYTMKKKIDSKCSFTAKCQTFNLVDEVYRFSLKNVRFKMEGAEYVNVPKMKVIAVKSGALEDGEPVAGPSSQTGSISGKKRKASNTDLDRPRPLSEEKDRREDKKRKTTKVKKGSS